MLHKINLENISLQVSQYNTHIEIHLQKNVDDAENTIKYFTNVVVNASKNSNRREKKFFFTYSLRTSLVKKIP